MRARDAEVLGALGRVAVESSLRALSRRSGIDDALPRAVCFVHRAGGSVNLSPHLHMVAIDGVLVPEADESLRFEAALPPSSAELDAIVRAIHARVVRWLRRHGHFDERALEERSNETPEESALDGNSRVCFSKGSFARLGNDPTGSFGDHEALADERAFEPRYGGRYAVEFDGINLHAGVRVDAGNDVGRERPFALRAAKPFARAAVGHDRRQRRLSRPPFVPR